MAYVKPVRPALIVAADKAEKFLSQKPDPAKIEYRKKLLEQFQKNNREK